MSPAFPISLRAALKGARVHLIGLERRKRGRCLADGVITTVQIVAANYYVRGRAVSA